MEKKDTHSSVNKWTIPFYTQNSLNSSRSVEYLLKRLLYGVILFYFLKKKKISSFHTKPFPSFFPFNLGRNKTKETTEGGCINSIKSDG